MAGLDPRLSGSETAIRSEPSEPLAFLLSRRVSETESPRPATILVMLGLGPSIHVLRRRTVDHNEFSYRYHIWPCKSRFPWGIWAKERRIRRDSVCER